MSLASLAEPSLLAAICDAAGIPLQRGRAFVRALANAPASQRETLLADFQTRATLPHGFERDAGSRALSAGTLGPAAGAFPREIPSLPAGEAAHPSTAAPSGHRPRMRSNVRPAVRAPVRSGVFSAGYEADRAKEIA